MVYNINMSDKISKAEIEYLLNLEKNCKSSQKYIFPSLGGKNYHQLIRKKTFC